MMNILLRKRHGRCLGIRIDSRGIRQASFFIVACWLLLNASTKAFSNTESVEYPVKLAFLYNFTKFVEWPPDSYRDPGAPLPICIVGHDPFSPDLEGELRTRTVAGHPIEVRTLRPTDTLSVCHMVFIPVTEKNRSGQDSEGPEGIKHLDCWRERGVRRAGRDHKLDRRRRHSPF